MSVRDVQLYRCARRDECQFTPCPRYAPHADCTRHGTYCYVLAGDVQCAPVEQQSSRASDDAAARVGR